MSASKKTTTKSKSPAPATKETKPASKAAVKKPAVKAAPAKAEAEATAGIVAAVVRAAAPVLAAAPAAPVKEIVPAKAIETTITAKSDIGFGNALYLRGEGPGLSWDKGVPMQFVSIGKWGWASHEATGPVKCRLYKNDETAALSGEVVLEPGKHVEVTALF